MNELFKYLSVAIAVEKAQLMTIYLFIKIYKFMIYIHI